MSDLEHMVRCCIEAAMPSLKFTKDLLILARAAIQNNTGNIGLRFTKLYKYRFIAEFS